MPVSLISILWQNDWVGRVVHATVIHHVICHCIFDDELNRIISSYPLKVFPHDKAMLNVGLFGQNFLIIRLYY